MHEKRKCRAVAIATALVAVAVLGLVAAPATASYAAFNSTTTVTGNTWSSSARFPCLSRTLVAPALFAWNFNTTSPTVIADDSGNGVTGVLSQFGSRIAGSCGVNGSPALSMSAPSDVVVASAAATSSPPVFSEQIWFKTTSTTGGQLMGFSNTSSGAATSQDRILWMGNDGTIHFGVFPSPTIVVSSPDSYNDGLWHEAIATLSGAGQSLYLDGQLVASNPQSTRAESIAKGYWTVGWASFRGWSPAPSSAGFSGSVDGVTVYPSGLTADQVEASFAQGH